MQFFLLCKFWLQAGPKGASSKAVTPPTKRGPDDDDADDVEEVQVKVVKIMKSESKMAPTGKPIEKKKMPAGGSAFSSVEVAFFQIFFHRFMFVFLFLSLLPMRSTGQVHVRTS